MKSTISLVTLILTTIVVLFAAIFGIAEVVKPHSATIIYQNASADSLPNTAPKLIACPVCGKEYSSAASNCPNCGNPSEIETCPVHIERASGFVGSGVNCYVYIDGSLQAELKAGESVDIELPLGSHTVSINSNVNNVANSSKSNVERFVINDTAVSVSIKIKAKGSWTGGTGQCVIDSIVVQ